MVLGWNSMKVVGLVSLALIGAGGDARAAGTAVPGGAATAPACRIDTVRVTPATTKATPGTSARLRPVAQVFRNDRADVTFELAPASTGEGITVSGRRGDLEVTKTVQASGEFVLGLATARDRVAIAVTGRGATVTRGRTTILLPRSEPSEGQAIRIRRLLADSEAVVQYRALTASLMETDDRSHPGLALIMSDATVGLLGGDVGAPGRIARLLGQRRNANARRAGMAVDCFTTMETRMMEAWNDYGSCYYSTAYNSFYQSMCSWRWTLQVESYWFNFIGCSGFNIS
jgi:hypothetical protein